MAGQAQLIVVTSNENLPRRHGTKPARRRPFDPHPSRGPPVQHPVKVYLRVVFLKIGEINTLKEKYHADVFLQARWKQPMARTPVQVVAGEAGEAAAAEWNPCLTVENVLGEAQTDVWQYKEKDTDGKVTVCECRRISGDFVENLELQHFPFDTQELSLTVTSELTEDEVELYVEEEELSSVNKQSFVDEQEWALYEHVEMYPKVSVKEYTSSKERHPAMLVMCHAGRRPGFFLWNIFLIMLLITLLAFATFSVPVELPQNRLQLSFTLVLTGVAFKFVVNQSLPKISYLTYMDKYIVYSMVYLCLVCVWHSVGGRLSRLLGSGVVGEFDWKALIGFAASYTMFHLAFALWIYNSAWKRRHLMVKKDEMYQAKLQRMAEISSNVGNSLKRHRMSVWNAKNNAVDTA